MTDKEIESYYGAIEFDHIKMFDLSRKIYPWRKAPVVKIEDLLYAMQNLQARELITGYRNGKIELHLDHKSQIGELYLRYRDVSTSVENLIHRIYTWIDPEKEIEIGKYVEGGRDVKDTLDSRSYFIDAEELEERPTVSYPGIISRDQVSWTNKSFEQMTTAFVIPNWDIDAHISCPVHHENPGGASDDYALGYIGESHSHYTYQYQPDDWEHIVPDLENVKLSYFDSERMEEAFASQKRMIIEDGSSQYHGDWIDKTYMAVLYQADYQNQKHSGEIRNVKRRYLQIYETDVFTPRLAVDAFHHAKSDIGYSSAVQDESKRISIVILDIGAIVMLKKENLMITEE